MCTRILWSSGKKSGEGIVALGRNMDWYENAPTDIWAFPAGLDRNGLVEENPVTWTSRYASLAVSFYGALVVDGINEKGFSANGLYLAESDYGERDASRPGLLLTTAVQYFLDSFATVQEAVDWIQESHVQLVPVTIGKRPGTGHISFADASGDSAIVEFLDGNATIHHGPEFTVMTNSPAYDQQLENAKQYEGFGGTQQVPGTPDSPGRYARASYYLASLPETADQRQVAANVLSVARNASTPFGINVPGQPNVSPTRWRIVSDLTNKVFFFESAVSPDVIWIPFSELDVASLNPGQALKLENVHEQDRAGNVSQDFVAAPELVFH